MPRAKALLLVASWAVLWAIPLLAVAKGGSGLGSGPIKTLAELIKVYDSSTCKECHLEIYQQWAKSHHARSMMGLKDFIFMSKYLKKGPLSVKDPSQAGLANFSCAKCHLPQLLQTSDAVAKELAAAVWRNNKQTLRRLNIGCLVCHRDKAVVHHRSKGDTIYGTQKLDDHEGTFKKVRKSSFMRSAAFCGQCHGLGPNFEFTPPVQCATLYGSYLHAYVADGGTKTCNDCHMKGKDHSFPPNFDDPKGTAALYRAALPMGVEVMPYTFQPGHKKLFPMIVLNVTIRNKAGHRIPDG